MAENSPPSSNPADDGTLVGTIKIAIEKAMQNTDVMMPVEVVAYDRATNRATVRHLVQMMASNGDKVDRANIASVRVYQFGNSKFSLSLPIKPGDKGWLKAADRDISLFQQDLDTKDAPNTRRMHSFQDGMFMPDAMAAGDVPAGEGDRVVLGNSGSSILSFDDDGFNFTVGGVTVTISAAGLTVTGGRVEHDGTNIGSDHKHTGVESGGSTTGNPV